MQDDNFSAPEHIERCKRALMTNQEILDATLALIEKLKPGLTPGEVHLLNELAALKRKQAEHNQQVLSKDIDLWEGLLQYRTMTGTGNKQEGKA